MKSPLIPLSTLFISGMIIACNGPSLPRNQKEEVNTTLRASAQLQPLRGSGVRGGFSFQEKDDGVRVFGTVTGLKANSLHAFHIHDVGDCGNNGENAGEHFNPLKAPHGKFGDLPHHAGDFPQLEADENGLATIDFTAETISLSEPKTNVLGRALIVHANEDKYTQPSGDAGARIACGVIEKKR